ncbi:MAG: Unknown protein [uncultured Sulfurovum sp.]|uniref:HNH nuclease domain-containing protein n=1 Tax=uncultured Sulfurovum sp. TaxID=269237 RepID=A0A6S6TGQ4_9BACT|nr:MAG: Unknown protein [uncultured Sulfurovum sp.]
MVEIKFNQELFDNHIEIISKSIYNLFLNIEYDGLEEETIECLNYIFENINPILSANTTELKKYIDNFEKKYPNSLKDGVELNKILRNELFEKEYNNWGGRSTYGAYSFVQVLDLKTCPYCNRNYTFVVNDETGKLRPEIDHFHPKSIYPFLAMSFFNLIPSCSICNHTKSNTVKNNLDNPYDINNSNYRFTYTPKNIEFSVVEKEKYNFDSFEIEIRGNKSNIVLFKLKQLYEQHKDIVLELLIKKAYYPQSYIKELSEFGFSQDEVYRYLFSNYNQNDDLHKRPLSKLIRDISDELGLT